MTRTFINTRFISTISTAILVSLSFSVGAASKAEIDANVSVALDDFYQQSAAGKILAEEAIGMLVFPAC